MHCRRVKAAVVDASALTEASEAARQPVKCDVCVCVRVCACACVCVSRGIRRILHHPVQTTDYLPIATSQIKLRQARGGQRDAFWPSLSLAGLRITPPSAQQTLRSLTTPTNPSLHHSLSLADTLPLPKHVALIFFVTK